MTIRRLPYLLTLIVLIVMAILGKAYINQLSATKIKIYNSPMQPTIMVPGSSASQERFNRLIAALNKKTKKHSVLKVTVSRSGKLTYTGAIASGDLKPYIVIAFENNHDGYSNIKKQSKWLSVAMSDLQRRYHFKKFNALGHSNGGLNWTIFLEKYYESDDFDIGTLMTVGTPYNFEETKGSHRTQLLEDLISNRFKLPSDLTVINVAGTQSYDGDYIVPFASVETGKYVFQKIVKHYTQITVTGNGSEHSDLPQNPEVIQLVQEKLLQRPQQRPNKDQ